MTGEQGSGLHLRARILPDAQRLRLEYEVANAGPQPAFLFDVLHGEWADGGYYPLDPGAYVEVGEAGVIVSRKLFPLAPGRMVEKRNIPFCTRLAPGEVHRGTVALALPLLAHDPYDEHEPGGRVEMREVIFQIGYFAGAPGSEGLGKLFPTDAGNRPGFDVFDQDRQLIAATSALGHVPCDLGSAA